MAGMPTAASMRKNTSFFFDTPSNANEVRRPSAAPVQLKPNMM